MSFTITLFIIVVLVGVWSILWILDGYVQDREAFEQEMLNKREPSKTLIVNYRVPKEKIKNLGSEQNGK